MNENVLFMRSRPLFPGLVFFSTNMLLKSLMINRVLPVLRSHFRRQFSISSHQNEGNELQVEYEPVSVEDYRQLIKTPEDEETIQSILDEYEYLKYTTDEAPRSIPVKYMMELMTQHPTRTTRHKQFAYLRSRELAIAEEKRLRRKKREKHEKMLAERKPYPAGTLFDEDNKPIYRRWHNSFFLHIADTAIHHSHDYKKRHATMFGQKLIMDLGYEDVNIPRTAKFIGFQAGALYSLNYQSIDPFDLTFSSFNPDSLCAQQIHDSNRNLYDSRTMISLEEKSFEELGMPKERMVYITSFSRTPYQNYNHDDIFVLPALHERSLIQPKTLARAKKLGIRTACLPFDDYVAWKVASKGLAFSHVVSILLNFKTNGNDWRRAFLDNSHVSRKLKSPEEVQEEETIRKSKWHARPKTMFKTI